MGGNGYAFAGDYSTKGCYAYKGGSYDGMIFYGVGGTEQQMKTPLSGSKYRPECAECATKGNLLILNCPF